MASSETSNSKIQVITPNDTNQDSLHPTTIFLSGPTNVPWRKQFLDILSTIYQQPRTTATGTNAPLKPVTIYDPTQPNWDSTWVEDYAADARYKAQTDWELAHIASSTLHVVFFDPRAQAPVTLLEFGLTAWNRDNERTLLVGCPAGYWKRGYVVAVCARAGIPLEETLEGLVQRVVGKLRV